MAKKKKVKPRKQDRAVRTRASASSSLAAEESDQPRNWSSGLVPSEVDGIALDIWSFKDAKAVKEAPKTAPACGESAVLDVEFNSPTGTSGGFVARGSGSDKSPAKRKLSIKAPRPPKSRHPSLEPKRRSERVPKKRSAFEGAILPFFSPPQPVPQRERPAPKKEPAGKLVKPIKRKTTQQVVLPSADQQRKKPQRLLQKTHARASKAADTMKNRMRLQPHVGRGSSAVLEDETQQVLPSRTGSGRQSQRMKNSAEPSTGKSLRPRVGGRNQDALEVGFLKNSPPPSSLPPAPAAKTARYNKNKKPPPPAAKTARHKGQNLSVKQPLQSKVHKSFATSTQHKKNAKEPKKNRPDPNNAESDEHLQASQNQVTARQNKAAEQLQAVQQLKAPESPPGTSKKRTRPPMSGPLWLSKVAKTSLEIPDLASAELKKKENEDVLSLRSEVLLEGGSEESLEAVNEQCKIDGCSGKAVGATWEQPCQLHRDSSSSKAQSETTQANSLEAAKPQELLVNSGTV